MRIKNTITLLALFTSVGVNIFGCGCFKKNKTPRAANNAQEKKSTHVRSVNSLIRDDMAFALGIPKKSSPSIEPKDPLRKSSSVRIFMD